MKKLFLAAAVIAATMTSCSKEESTKVSDPGAISFSTFVDGTKASEAYVETLKADLAGFKVLAGHEQNGFGGVQFTANYMWNQPVIWDATAGAWTYSPIKYWPTDGNIRFYGYYPEAANVVVSGNAAKGNPTLDVTTPRKAANQLDVLADYPGTWKCEPNGQYKDVKFEFEHIMSQIRFVATLDEEIPESNLTKVTVSKVVVDYGEIVKQGVYDLHAEAWTLGDKFAPATTSENIANALINPIKGTDNRPLNTENLLMLIPQSYNDDQIKVTITYDITTLDPNLKGGESCITSTKSAYLPAFTWEPGMKYVYVAEIGIDQVVFGDITVVPFDKYVGDTTVEFGN